MFAALRLFLWMTFILGGAYPLLITGIAQITMNHKANGSLIGTVGSNLIGQKFENDKYFWGRPSASDYNAVPSGASNLGPTSKALKEAVEKRKAKVGANAPPELLYASGSGLDPHISPETAIYQIDRIIKARGLNETTDRAILEELIRENTHFRTVNVLQLNLSLGVSRE